MKILQPLTVSGLIPRVAVCAVGRERRCGRRNGTRGKTPSIHALDYTGTAPCYRLAAEDFLHRLPRWLRGLFAGFVGFAGPLFFVYKPSRPAGFANHVRQFFQWEFALADWNRYAVVKIAHLQTKGPPVLVFK